MGIIGSFLKNIDEQNAAEAAKMNNQQLPGQAGSSNYNPPNTGQQKPQYNYNAMVSQLTSGNPAYRMAAAQQIKEANQPLLNLILYNCKQKFDAYSQQLRYSNINLTSYYSTGLQESLYANIPYNLKTFTANRHRDWISSLEGARLYLYICSDSVETGLLELMRILSNDPSHTYTAQAQYLIKYSGNHLVEPLLVHIKNPYPEIRAWTIYLISVHEDVRTFGPIRDALNDESATVRNAAAEAVKQLKIPLIDTPHVVHREVIKEIVKIPCKYCGTYIVNTCTSCPNCGGPLNK